MIIIDTNFFQALKSKKQDSMAALSRLGSAVDLAAKGKLVACSVDSVGRLLGHPKHPQIITFR